MVRATPSTVRIAVEAKAVMTEHRKAIKNRKRDLEAHHAHVHDYDASAIAAGLVAINASATFQSPLDGEEWHPLPGRFFAHVSSEGSLHPTGRSIEDVASLVVAEGREPLGHELLREAWFLRMTNPRSALVTGVAALEVGFKEFGDRSHSRHRRQGIKGRHETVGSCISQGRVVVCPCRHFREPLASEAFRAEVFKNPESHGARGLCGKPPQCKQSRDPHGCSDGWHSSAPMR
jgi:hypothetical protein